MRGALSLPLALLVLGVGVSSARVGEKKNLSPEEVARVLATFQHQEHDEAFQEEQLACVACHQVGGQLEGDWSAEELTGVFMEPPIAGCHYCHKPEGKRTVEAPEGCQICHGEGFAPDSHGPFWVQTHGPEVRMIRPGCYECHDTGQCLSCHEDRGAMARNGHPPGWRAVHGIEARFDPQMCVTCHAGDSCVRCHTGGRAPW